jgi:tRNA pseudouridine38-40 synthase
MSEREHGNKTRQSIKSVRNIRLKVAFDGSAYSGWQIQKNRPTVQGTLRDAIHRVTGERVVLIGSGRTDAGTHARALVANFISNTRIPASNLVRALNSLLPHDIRILSARNVPPEFHARRDARSKTYRYQIYRGPVMPPHLAREHFHFPYTIDVGIMIRAAEQFVGRHDFASFAAGSNRKPKLSQSVKSMRQQAVGSTKARTADTHRHVFRCEITRTGHRLLVTVEGSGFLHHMVRNMVGTLLEVGRGCMTMKEFNRLFEQGDRTMAGFTAPARGLILMKVRY